MKKIILPLFILIGIHLQAQTPVITNADLADPGASYLMYTDTLPSYVPGNTGPGQLWDFSQLAKHDSTAVNVITPQAHPLGYLFPQANEALSYQSNGMAYFFTKASDGLFMQGMAGTLLGGDDTIRIVFSKPDTMLTTPTTLLTAFSSATDGDTKSPVSIAIDTSIFGVPLTIMVDSVRVKHAQIKFSIADAAGQLSTPDGSIATVRQFIYQEMSDSVWAYLNVPPPFNAYSGWYFFQKMTDTSHTYVWWANGIGIPLLRMYYHPDGYVTSIEWIHVENLSVNETGNNENMMAWPNPASEKMNISLPADAREIRIFNANAALVHRDGCKNISQYQLNTSSFPTGMYFYEIISNSKISKGKFQIIHQ